MNLPQPFITEITPILGSELNDFLQALQQNSPTSIRVNNKTIVTGNKPVSWCETGFYLNERPLFTADPLFHAGAYYVQEASSMFVEQAIKQYISEPINILDLCAAPGGKSTHLSSLLPENSLLVSNEIIRSRVYILAENMMKWGNSNVVVTNNSPDDFSKLHSFFDAMLIDAPCSGEGMFRKDEGAINEWSPDNVKKCVERQRNIVSAVWSALKTGGILIYSTCTYNRHENEENIQWIINELGAELLPLKLNDDLGITVSDYGYRFYPHKTCGEGFFLSVLRKTSDDTCHCGLDPQSHRKRDKKQNKKKEIAGQARNDGDFKKQLLNPNNWKISMLGNIVRALPEKKAEEIEWLEKNLNPMYSGIPLAEQKGKDFIPETALALSKHIDLNQFNTVEVDLKTAILYLQKEAIEIPPIDKGYVLLTYQKVPIGWVKNIGNRCNNLYPNEWRIRMKIPSPLNPPKGGLENKNHD